MTNEEAINELLQCYSLYSPFKTAKKTNEAISMAIKALEETHTLNDNTLTIKVSEEDIDKVKRIMLDYAPWCKVFYEDDKDTNVPSKSALDHIHNVVRDDAYKCGYEQGKADMAHTIKDKTLFIKVSEEDVDRIKRVMLDCDPWCKTFYEDAPGEAHWIKKYTPDDGEIYECDSCGVTWQFNDGGPEENEAYYCPKCGFKMVPKEGEADE